MKKWKEYYQPPFRAYHGIYIFGKNNISALDTAGMFFKGSDEFLKDVAKMLNDEEPSRKFSNKVRFDRGDFIVTGKDGSERTLLRTRGWGRLTGTGGYNLKLVEASKIQDSFSKYVLKKLNKHIK